MKKIIVLIVLIFAMALLAGCTSTPPAVTPTVPATTTTTAIPQATTAAPVPSVTGTQVQALSFAEEIAVIQKRTDENGPIMMAMNTTTEIDLKENPTTGYMWNATVTSGLKIVNDSYIPPANQIPGAGGMHSWVIKAVGLGNQTFTAVYHRPWEPVNANDTTFTTNFVVTA